MKLTLIVFVLSTGLAASICSAGILAGPVTNAANGHVYYLLTQGNWTQSEAEAVTLGGHLATINDRVENDWVFQTFGSYGGLPRGLWIGLNDARNEGRFVWASGENVTFTFWDLLQPDNGVNGGISPENYVHIWPPTFNATGTWNDYNDLDALPSPSNVPMHGVVEIAPPPVPPVLSIRVSQVELCWPTVSSTWYRLEYRSTLTSNQWLPLTTNWLLGNGASFCAADAVPVGSPERFYRVSVTNAPP